MKAPRSWRKAALTKGGTLSVGAALRHDRQTSPVALNFDVAGEDDFGRTGQCDVADFIAFSGEIDL